MPKLHRRCCNMTPFDAQTAGTELLQTQNIGLPHTTSATTNAAITQISYCTFLYTSSISPSTQFYAVSSLGQEHWRQHIAASEIQFNVPRGSLTNDTCIGESAGPFDSLPYDDSVLFDNNADDVLDAIKAARQARRKAQNRVA